MHSRRLRILHVHKNFEQFVEALPKSVPKLKLPKSLMAWAKQVISLDGTPLSFDQRDYLKKIYADDSKQIVIAKGRQMEISTFFAIKILYFMWYNPGVKVVYVTNRWGSVREFSKRLTTILQNSPLLTEYLIDPKNQLVTELNCKNGAALTMLSGHDSFRQVRGIAADLVLLDECQESKLEDLANLKEALSHSKYGYLFMAGTGAVDSSAWHKRHSKGTQEKWNGKRWVKSNDNATFPSYTIGMDLASWISPDTLNEKRIDYPSSSFAREILGQFPTDAQIPLPETLVRRCFDDTISFTGPADVDRTKGKVVIGIDLAGGGISKTVATIIQVYNDAFKILAIEKYDDSSVSELGQKLSDLVQSYEPDLTVSDLGGNTGALQILESNFGNKLKKCQLAEADVRFNFNHYVDADKVTVDRTFCIQKVIELFEQDRITIPAYDSRVEWVIDHLTCNETITAETTSGKSVLRFVKPKSSPNDFLMSLVFAYVSWHCLTSSDTPHRIPYKSRIVRL